MNRKISAEHIRIFLMMFILIICMLTFAAIQPYGDGPDEINRFKIVEYIYEHGTIPVGDDPEVLIDGYGGSYAFQPMLTYMIDGYLLRALRIFAPSLEMRVFLSRLVNVFFGCLSALYVKKLSDLLFTNKKTAWAFTLAIVFLPQNLFIHTYVNTDSMGLLSIVIVLHAIVAGMKNDFLKGTCIELAIGVILCALSYYNCYGIIVCAVLFFAAYFHKRFRSPKSAGLSGDDSTGLSEDDSAGLSGDDSAGREASSASDNRVSSASVPAYDNRVPSASVPAYDNRVSSASVPAYDIHALLKKGIFISAIVLLGIGWWFIRNALLYDGDFLALEARNICAAKTCLEGYDPYTRDTYQRLGIPLMDMIFKTDYFTLVWKSFIAMFGPMLIPTHHYIYMAFKDVFFMAVIGLILPVKVQVLTWASRPQKWLVHLTMLLGIIIPVVLALYYSYTFDFQPQGRYYLPMVIPFMYFMAMGVEKLFERFPPKASNILYHLLYAFLTLCLLYSTFISMLGYYRTNGVSLF